MEEARAAPHGGVPQPRLWSYANVRDVRPHSPEQQHPRQQLFGQAAATLRALRSQQRACA